MSEISRHYPGRSAPAASLRVSLKQLGMAIQSRYCSDDMYRHRGEARAAMSELMLAILCGRE